MAKTPGTLRRKNAQDAVTQVNRYELPTGADPIWARGHAVVKLLSDYLEAEATRA